MRSWFAYNEHVRKNPTTWFFGLAIFLLTGACNSANPAGSTECHTLSGASLCLVKRGASTYALRASGLRPGSEITLVLGEPKIPPTGGLAPYTADSSGKFPAAGQVPAGVVVPAGSGPVLITLTATAANGSPATTTFTR
jgi:hypothetical protein